MRRFGTYSGIRLQGHRLQGQSAYKGKNFKSTFFMIWKSAAYKGTIRLQGQKNINLTKFFLTKSHKILRVSSIYFLNHKVEYQVNMRVETVFKPIF